MKTVKNAPIDEKNYDLWKYFSNDAAQVKDKLWSISIWLFALLGSLVGFIAKQFSEKAFAFEHPVLVLVVASIGITMSIYAYWMITSYGKYIRTAWNRTDYLRRQLPKLDEAWKQGYANYPYQNNSDKSEAKKENPAFAKTDEIPSFVVRIRWLAKGFLVLFVLITLMAIYVLMNNPCP